MFTRLINIEKAKYFLSGAQLYDELKIGVPPSTYDYRQTWFNISKDSYPLASERLGMLEVIIVDVQLLYYLRVWPELQ